MRVYIVRHGKAFDADLVGRYVADGGPATDFDRELLPRGQQQAEYLGQRVATVEPRPEVILTSRYPRARQTAEVMRRALNCPFILERALEVDHPIGEAIELIEREERAGRQAVMLVGHNPQLGELIAVLSSGLKPQDMILKTGELVALDIKPAKMIGGAKIVGRLRMSNDKNDESIAGGVFALDGQSGGGTGSAGGPGKRATLMRR